VEIAQKRLQAYEANLYKGQEAAEAAARDIR